jgi:membrane protein required for colicin V production
MNSIDLVLALGLLVCALRGYWRGFFRECFALLALVSGVAAAAHFAGAGAAVMQERLRLPASLESGVAFVVIFAVVHTVINLVGVGIDRLGAATVLQPISRIAGAAFGIGKGATVFALVLLFLHLFPLAPSLDEPIMSSRIGRPLVGAASDVVRLGMQAVARSDAGRAT